MFVTFKFISGDFCDDQSCLGFEVHWAHDPSIAGKVSDKSVHGSVIRVQTLEKFLTLHYCKQNADVFILPDYSELIAQPRNLSLKIRI